MASPTISASEPGRVPGGQASSGAVGGARRPVQDGSAWAQGAFEFGEQRAPGAPSGEELGEETRARRAGVQDRDAARADQPARPGVHAGGARAALGGLPEGSADATSDPA